MGFLKQTFSHDTQPISVGYPWATMVEKCKRCCKAFQKAKYHVGRHVIK